MDEVLPATGAGDQSVATIETTIAPPAAIAKPAAKRKPAARKARKAPADQLIEGSATRPQPRDENGRALDQWRLPLNGPARLRSLEALGKRDPHTHPEDWPAPSAAQE